MEAAFSVKENFERRIRELFENETFSKIECIKRGFDSIDYVGTNSLLFIGLNPSIITKNENPLETPYYNIKDRTKEYPKYFGVLENIGEATGENWTHLDLLLVRETSQKKVIELMQSQEGKDFVAQQLKIAKEIIEAAQPKIIVVANTLSRELMGKLKKFDNYPCIGYNCKFDETLGTDRITTEGALKDTPVFFTSMLTGQRALDLGSVERLKWHIRRVAQIIEYKKTTIL